MPFHQKIPCFFLLLACCLAGGLAHGQTNFNNPSFEGTPGTGTTPPGWSNCSGTPDVAPGVFGITLAPASGSTYIGLVTNTGGYKESVGQAFTFTAGVTYSFSINLARSALYSDANYGQAGRLNVWAGSANCGKTQLIWQSPVATSAWQNYNISFTPTTNYSAITFEAEYPGGTGQASNVLIDNLRLNCSTTTPPTVAAAGTLASQGNVWDLSQPLNLSTNATVTGVSAAQVKWTAEYQRNGQTQFSRVIGNPSGYRFEAPGTVVLRPTYFCGGNPLNFAAPLTIMVNDGFKQKIDVDWPGAHIDISIVCEVSVKRNGQTYFKGTTSGEGKLYVEGLRNGDQLLVKTTKITRPYAWAVYNVTFSAEQATPVVINLSPNFVDAGL
ncbi:MAG TPA: hypothetical protein VF646_17600 [Cytophagales bacterium]